MGKVFTITPELENLGAMKSGGQGSVYKGRRIGEIITAVKLLPTPIFSESKEDKNFRDFSNEVEKLKKVNQQPNPNIVKILSSGLSETGNFPFIEMEYIEGPDLEEILQSSEAKVFTIKEVVKVAVQLSNALAHCHKIGVKHGDIKSNNVKFNSRTGNYILLDFGLAVMTDEQRRTSLRRAGAVEFMAPEQNEGQMLFETDIYSFGVILFEILTGTVPFPLQGKGETARNEVRLAHIDSAPPDFYLLRKEALQKSTWPNEVKVREMEIPTWLTTVIYKCLSKNPHGRYFNGTALHDFITHNLHTANNAKPTAKSLEIKEQLQKQLLLYKSELANKEREF
jgi:serine/threonine-protein kinase